MSHDDDTKEEASFRERYAHELRKKKQQDNGLPMTILEYRVPSSRLLNSFPHDLHDTYIFYIHHIITPSSIYHIPSFCYYAI
jgi:hypothetical protein